MKRIPVKIKRDLVRVEWNDAYSPGSPWVGNWWIDNKAYSPCVSVGFRLRNDSESVTLAMTLDSDDDTFGNVLAIPKGMVTRQTVLVKARELST